MLSNSDIEALEDILDAHAGDPGHSQLAHTRGLIETDDLGCIAPAVAQGLPWIEVPMRAGDALFFGSYAPHRSASNRTASPRRNLYLTYNAAADGAHRETYYRDKRRALASRGGEESGSVRLSTIGHFRGKAVQGRD